MDGGSFSDTVFVPFLFGLLLVGLFFALIGFWRVGASYATQLSAQRGSVAPAEGDDALSALWRIFTNGDVPNGGFAVDADSRTVQSDISASQTFDQQQFGTWTAPINAQTRTRSERFYPGGPVCDGGTCSE